MIRREHYINQIKGFYDSDLIKIITGIRRSGKSVILSQIMEDVKNQGAKTIYINFEDRFQTSNIKTADDLIKYVLDISHEEKCYVFLDEIQELNDWQLACKTLRLHKCSVFITGSNSKLLSSEFTKELSGRYVAFRIRPFVYKELIEYGKELDKEISVSDYLVWGGFPKRIEFNSEADQRVYLNDLAETIIFKDLIKRYNIRKPELFNSLVNYVLRSNARVFSVKSIKDYIKQYNATCSINTIQKYLSYLENAYIISSVKQYSTKIKRELAFYEKLYNQDVAFNSIYVNDGRFDLTHNLENIIYNELEYMGYDLSVYVFNGKEVDFRATKDGKTYYIQVAYSVVDDKAYQREFEAFKLMDNSCEKILITNDDTDYSTSTVRHIQLKDFLLMESL